MRLGLGDDDHNGKSGTTTKTFGAATGGEGGNHTWASRATIVASCNKAIDRQGKRGVYPKRILRRPQDKWRGTHANRIAELWGAMECSLRRVLGHTKARYKLDSQPRIAQQPEERRRQSDEGN